MVGVFFFFMACLGGAVKGAASGPVFLHGRFDWERGEGRDERGFGGSVWGIRGGAVKSEYVFCVSFG